MLQCVRPDAPHRVGPQGRTPGAVVSGAVPQTPSLGPNAAQSGNSIARSHDDYTGLRECNSSWGLAWNGSWNDSPDNPSAPSAASAMTRAICAASTFGAPGRTSCKRLVGATMNEADTEQPVTMGLDDRAELLRQLYEVAGTLSPRLAP